MSEEGKERGMRRYWLIMAIGFLLMASGAIIASINKFGVELGAAGDSFGIINSVFSAAAVFMAIHAINLQRKDLQPLTRK